MSKTLFKVILDGELIGYADGEDREFEGSAILFDLEGKSIGSLKFDETLQFPEIDQQRTYGLSKPQTVFGEFHGRKPRLIHWYDFSNIDSMQKFINRLAK